MVDVRQGRQRQLYITASADFEVVHFNNLFQHTRRCDIHILDAGKIDEESGYRFQQFPQHDHSNS